MTNTNKIDFTKPLQTRSGLKVRIISTNTQLNQPADEFSVVAEVEGFGYKTYTQDGLYFTNGAESSLDLQNIPEETFEQKVERFKKSEFYISDKTCNDLHEVVTWDDTSGYHVWVGFEEAFNWVDFK
jgi:hypothetical protein